MNRLAKWNPRKKNNNAVVALDESVDDEQAEAWILAGGEWRGIGSSASDSPRSVALDARNPSDSFGKTLNKSTLRDSKSSSSDDDDDDVQELPPMEEIPNEHKTVIRNAFGQQCDIYKDVLKVPNDANPRQFRLAYFRRGREVLQQPRQPNTLRHVMDDSVASLPRVAKLRFQAVSMAYDIVSTPVWKAWYEQYHWGDSKKAQQQQQPIVDVTHMTNPILRTSSNHSRSAGRGIRWNDQVEELVFTQAPHERLYKSSREPIDAEQANADDRGVDVETSRQQIFQEAQELAARLDEERKQQKDKRKKRPGTNIVSGLLSELDTGLDGLETSFERLTSTFAGQNYNKKQQDIEKRKQSRQSKRSKSPVRRSISPVRRTRDSSVRRKDEKDEPVQKPAVVMHTFRLGADKVEDLADLEMVKKSSRQVKDEKTIAQELIIDLTKSGSVDLEEARNIARNKANLMDESIDSSIYSGMIPDDISSSKKSRDLLHDRKMHISRSEDDYTATVNEPNTDTLNELTVTKNDNLSKPTLPKNASYSSESQVDNNPDEEPDYDLPVHNTMSSLTDINHYPDLYLASSADPTQNEEDSLPDAESNFASYFLAYLSAWSNEVSKCATTGHLAETGKFLIDTFQLPEEDVEGMLERMRHRYGAPPVEKSNTM